MKLTEKSFNIILISSLTVLALLIPIVIIQYFSKNQKRYIIKEANSSHGYYLDNYMDLTQLNDYLKNFARINDYFYKLETLGLTASKNPIYDLILEGPRPKPIILIVSGILANDWRSILTSLHVLNKFIANYCQHNPFYSFSYHFVPLFNPDGFAYSTSLPNRAFWVKNHNTNKRRKIIGVNIFYNFDSNWVLYDETDQIFAGMYPFSEQESKLFRDFFLKNKHNIEAIFLMFSPQNKEFKNKEIITLPEIGVNSTKEWKLMEKLVIDTLDKDNHRFKYVRSGTLKETQNGRMDNWILDTTKSVKVINIQSNYVKVPGENTAKLIRDLGDDVSMLINSISKSLAKQKLQLTPVNKL